MDTIGWTGRGDARRAPARRGRWLLGVVGLAGLVALGACGGDDDDAGPAVGVEISTPSSEVAADPEAAPTLDELCAEFDALVADPSPEAASTFLHAEDPATHPTGVAAELQAIVDGTSTEVDATVGYWEPVCTGDDGIDVGGVDDGASEGTSDTEEERAAAGALPISARTACLGLFDAWEAGDRAGATRFGDADAIDELFSRDFSPPAGAAVRYGAGGCFLTTAAGGGATADVVIVDSDIEAMVVEVTWYDDFFDDPDRAGRFDETS